MVWGQCLGDDLDSHLQGVDGYTVLQCVYNYLVNGGGHCLTMDVTLVCTVWSLVLGRAEDGPLCPTWCSTALQGMGVVHLAVGWTWPCVGMGGCLFLTLDCNVGGLSQLMTLQVGLEVPKIGDLRAGRH